VADAQQISAFLRIRRRVILSSQLRIYATRTGREQLSLLPSIAVTIRGGLIRNLAERLNDKAHSATMGKEKLRLLVCGPLYLLAHFVVPPVPRHQSTWSQIASIYA
jgi:hypothetical protein